MNLIIVESPPKAKAINEYLKNEKEKYFALSSMGHIRNLIPKSDSVEVENNFNYKWEFTPQWQKIKKELLEKAKEAKKIIIASDPDREGEAICWHLKEILQKNKISTPIERIVFYSISKESIKEAIANPIEFRTGLVESYLARIGLDYLFGFSVSPLLWRKIPCCKSAGRVQSPALKMVVERENEIQNFKSKQYETIQAQFNEINLLSNLISFDDKFFEKGMIFEEKIETEIFKNGIYKIEKIKSAQFSQTAPAPLITATLLQIASTELNFSTNQTMLLAQKLYEGFNIEGTHKGLITYMRTDSFNIINDAIKQIREKIKQKFGSEYVAKQVVEHKQKAKNAQEAHEAIRPVDINLEPNSIEFPEENLQKLYKLIWERTLASQCANAITESTTISINGKLKENTSIFELKASKEIFAGYKQITKEEKEEEFILPELKEGQELNLKEIIKKQHQTQPLKRYSEASLIQQLKKQGIGRPGTYSKIFSTLYERDYIKKEKKSVIPTQKGWIVTGFLNSFFPTESAYEFTSNLEEKLDEITNNNETHEPLLKTFWEELNKKILETQEKSPAQVSAEIENQFPEYFLNKEQKCTCGKNIVLKISKFGAIRGCENYPECKKIINLEQKIEPKIIEIENKSIILKFGPYGPYIEFENKKVPIPKIWQKEIEEFEAEKALFLAQLPKKIATYNNNDILINIGRFGPYLKCADIIASIKDPMQITPQEAIKKIEAKLKFNEKKAKKDL